MHLSTASVSLLGLISFASAQWHINSLQASCRGSECSYLFNVLGNATDNLPYFQAQCTARTGPRDKTYRPCTLTSQVSDHKFTVEEVQGFLSLAPLSPSHNKLSVQLKFNDGNGKVEWWTATEKGKYRRFSKGLKDFDIVPVYTKGTA